MLDLVEPESLGLSSPRLDRISDWMEGYVSSGKLPGALTLVARGGRIAYLRSLGHRDVACALPLDLDTLLRFYSMTKPITSVAVMMLYEEGRFQLDDQVGRYIPAFADLQVYVSGAGEEVVTEPARSPMTIHQLLTHTCGLTYGLGATDPISALYRERKTDFYVDDGPLEEVVERLARVPLVHHPGERWNYGVSTDVLGRLVEIFSGQRFDRFLAARIFEPLGMRDTFFEVPAEHRERLAMLYGPTAQGGLEPLEPPGVSPYFGPVSTFSGGAGLVSCIEDYYRFCELLRCKGELDGTRLLGRKTVEFMTCNHLPGDLADMGRRSFNETTFEGIGFGLGFAVMLDPARAAVMSSPGEYTWGGAASTAFWIDPVEDLSVIFLTQLLPSSTYPLRRELRVLSYQALIR